jgi:hypothetical protein
MAARLDAAREQPVSAASSQWVQDRFHLSYANLADPGNSVAPLLDSRSRPAGHADGLA